MTSHPRFQAIKLSDHTVNEQLGAACALLIGFQLDIGVHPALVHEVDKLGKGGHHFPRCLG